MAGKIIADTIQTEASFLQLNVSTTRIATMNASGIYSNTGTKMIGYDGTIGVATIANTAIDGVITATQMAANSVNATILQTNSIENYMATSGRPLSNRNLINNGAMQVAQRNTSVTGITSEGYYTADRWNIILGSAGTWTMNVESSGPTGTEFGKSANVICTTADSSLSAGDYFLFAQRIEGQNLQGIKKGTANAESLTVSFYVKSSNTGTYICEFRDIDNNRQISKSYTIDAANTWEKKTITIPPDTTGQLDNDNGNSFQLSFWLAAGSAYTSGTLNDTAWETTTGSKRAVGQLNLANATGNYWAVTGVKLETGTVATPYEWMDYGTELSLCQRYYQVVGSPTSAGDLNAMSFKGYNATGEYDLFTLSLLTQMRTDPTTTKVGTWAVTNCGQPSVTGQSQNSFSFQIQITSTGRYVATSNNSGYFTFSAEL